MYAFLFFSLRVWKCRVRTTTTPPLAVVGCLSRVPVCVCSLLTACVGVCVCVHRRARVERLSMRHMRTNDVPMPCSAEQNHRTHREPTHYVSESRASDGARDVVCTTSLTEICVSYRSCTGGDLEFAQFKVNICHPHTHTEEVSSVMSTAGLEKSESAYIGHLLVCVEFFLYCRSRS